MRALIAACLFLASPASAEVPRVVTDIPVIQSLVAQVMGDLGEPAVLLGQGGNAHSYQMRPSEARHLQDADVVFWISPKMTPWLERGIESGTSARVVALLETPGTHRRDFGPAQAEAGDHDHAEGDAAPGEAGHEAGDAEAGGHLHSGLDPHAWLDPGNAVVWLDTIAKELSALDPEHAGIYRANAGSARASVARTDAEVKAMLASAPHAPVVMFHDAYGYFAEHYGLDVAGTIALGDAAAPGAARLAEIRRQLETGGVACMFPEAQHDPKLAMTLADGTPVRVGAALDPSGSGTEPGPDLYQRTLLGLGRAISDCLASR